MSETNVVTLRHDEVGPAVAELSQRGQTLTLVGPGSEQAPALALTPSAVPASILRADCLVDAEAGASMRAVTELLDREGFIFPLDGVVDDETLLSWCVAGDAFLETFCSGFEGVTAAGEALRTARAPRHACGPDAGAAAFFAAPSVLVLRARLRVLRKEAVRWEVTTHRSSRDTAAKLRAAMLHGEAFAVQADRNNVRVLVGDESERARGLRRMDHGPTSSGQKLTPLARGPLEGRLVVDWGEASLAGTLDDGAVFLGAPCQGRLGAYRPLRAGTVRLASMREAVEALARAMEVDDVA